MKLEYTLINGKTNTEPEFQKQLIKTEFSEFPVFQAITQETYNVISNIDSSSMESIIATFTNPNTMNGMPTKVFPYLLFNDPTTTYRLALYIGRETLNYPFQIFEDIENPTAQFTEVLELHIIEKDGGVTNKNISAMIGDWDNEIINVLKEDGTCEFKYYIRQT